MYLDPSMGGMLLQIIIAIVAAAGAIAFSFRRKIANIFKKNKVNEGLKTDFEYQNHEDVVDMLNEKSEKN